MKRWLPTINLFIFILGIILFFVNERYFYTEQYYKAISYASVLIILISLFIVFSFILFTLSHKQTQQLYAWIFVAGWRSSIFISILLYMWYASLLSKTGVSDNVYTQILLILWLLFFVLGIFAGIGVEFSFRSLNSGEFAEMFRIKNATIGWLSIGILFSFMVCINYIGVKKDKSFDLTYLKISKPSDATLNLIQSFSDNLKIIVFYPVKNEVFVYVKEYISALKQAVGQKVEVNYFDVELNPSKAEQYEQSRNGRLVFVAGDSNKKEILTIGLNLASARSMIRNMDANVQQTLLKLKEVNKTIYFTSGHGELLFINNSDNPFRSVSLLEKILKTQNIKIKELNLASGSVKEVPADAACVMIVGPSRPFLNQEVKVLKEYINRGGSLFILLDVFHFTDTSNVLMSAIKETDPIMLLLKDIGIEFKKEVLANENNYVQLNRAPSDKWFIFSNIFTSHESIINLARHEERIAVLMYQSGHLIGNHKPGWKFYETIKSLPQTFVDLNKNYRFDSSLETKQSYIIGAVAVRENNDKENNNKQNNQNIDNKVTKPLSKVIVMADAQVVSDALIRNTANMLFVLDSIRWILGLNEVRGTVQSEEDIPIKHTNKENILWFNLTIIGVPILVLLFGLIFANKSLFKRKVRQK